MNSIVAASVAIMKPLLFCKVKNPSGEMIPFPKRGPGRAAEPHSADKAAAGEQRH